MVNALLGFSFNGGLPVIAVALGSTTLAMVMLAGLLGAAALMLVPCGTVRRGAHRRAVILRTVP